MIFQPKFQDHMDIQRSLGFLQLAASVDPNQLHVWLGLVGRTGHTIHLRRRGGFMGDTGIGDTRMGPAG